MASYYDALDLPARFRRALLVSTAVLLSALLGMGHAQVKSTITPDGTLGTVVTQSGTVHTITGGTRPGNGPNLFHSFDRFSVGTNDTARFSGPSGIVNILSRVTGGQQSVIDGRLQSTIPGANLYLLNPSGVLFGPNASLDLSGSFHVSTADYVRLADGARFFARLSDTSTLSVAPPAAFGFLGPTPASITMQDSTLRVPEGKALSVVGGDMQIVGGQLVAPSGRIQLASVAAAGEVIPVTAGPASDLQVDSFAQLGRIALSQGALLDASGNGGGVVLLRSGHLLVDGSNIFADNTGPRDGSGLGLDLRVAADAIMTHGSSITTDSYIPDSASTVPISLRAGHARDLRLTAGSVALDNSVIGSRPFASGGDGGNVLVQAGTLALTNGAQISSSTFGPGQGGTLTVLAQDTVTVTGGAFIDSSTLGAGHGGTVTVHADMLSLDGKANIAAQSRTGSTGAAGGVTVEGKAITLTGGAFIDSSTFGLGQGGSVRITATDTLTLSGSSSITASAVGTDVGAGAAGSIVVTAPRVTVTAGAQMSSSTFGAGHGGDLTVRARDTLTLAGESSQGTSSGLFTSAEQGSSGNAGALRVEAGTLTLSGGAQLSSTTSGLGRAGDIEVTASTVAVTGGAQIRNGTFGSGQGGRVTVRATEAVTLAGTSPDGALASGIRVGPLGQGAGNAGSPGQVTTTLTPDGTLGTTVTQSSTVMVEAPTVTVTGGAQIVGNRTSYDITGGTRPGNGPNLFHSFDRLNIGTNDTVRFSGPSGIENILSRVTGGQASVIDGQLQSTTPGANVYLLNPSGVLFGPNATLDVGGAFHVSTADYLRLADGARFSAHLSETSVLSGAPPAAFGFVSPQPAAISIQGSTLQVPEGATLSVIGGDIDIVGNGSLPTLGTVLSPFKNIPVRPFFPNIEIQPTLAAPGGRLHLASVASPGEVELGPLGQPEGLRVDTFARLGKLEIREAFLDVSGNKGGTVRLRGERLLIDDAFIGASTGEVDGGGIDMRVTADLAMRNVGIIRAGTSGAGRGGDITVEAGRLMLTDGSEINNTTSGPGPGGNVSVMATDSITISGRHQDVLTRALSFSGLVTNAFGDGAAGRLFVSTPTLQIEDGVIQALTRGNGAAGHIQLEVGSVTLTGGAQISSSSGATDLSTGKLAVGRGPGGEVRITARDFMTIAGHDQDGAPSGVFTGTSGSGPAGPLTLSVPRLQLEEGQIESTTTGDGRAGDLMLTVGSLSLTGGARVTSSSNSTASGQGGNITIAATEAITITGTASDGAPSALASSTFGSGAAGHMVLSAPTLSLEDGVIAARSTGQGAAGEIRIQAREMFRSQHGMVTSASAGSGNAGTLTLEVGRLLLTDGARLSSSASSTGQGGAVSVTAVDTVRIAGRDAEGNASGLLSTTASPLAGAGAAGTIIVNARALELEEGVIQASSSGAGAAGAIAVTVGSLAVTGGAQLAGNTSSTGQGGTVTVTATDAVTIGGQGSRLSTSTTGQGQGGNITLQAQQLQLRDGATIAADSTGPGNAGNVAITAQETVLLTHGSVVTRATQADGGNIQITTPTLLRLRDSAITAEVGGGASTVGGSITIDPQFVLLQNSQIVANAFQGHGGNIRIQAQQAFLADPASQVSASSALGINGQVAIQAPVTSISGAIAPLPQAFAQAAELLRSRCAERLREGTVSRFVIGGRDGVPLEPGSLLLSPLQRVGQEAGVQEGQRQLQNLAPQHEWVTSAQAHAREEWEGECARWTGQLRPPGAPKRRR